MKIASSTVTMASQNRYAESTVTVESLKISVDKGSTPVKQVANQERDSLLLSDQAKVITSDAGVAKVNGEEDSIMPLSEADKRKIELLESFIKSLRGKKIKFVFPKKCQLKEFNSNSSINNTTPPGVQAPRQREASERTLVYNRSVTHYESESTAFSAQAMIKTQDGREINVALQLNLSREFLSKNELSLSINAPGAVTPVAVDPLVLNYNVATASVTAEKYQFDIDADGTLDQISFAGSGSGFLALDLNKDGTINDGKELFGPNTGNGFRDLAAYDSDQNNWIDENDAIYDKLRIWSKDADGKDYLFALGEKGIGAIYLGNVSTHFALKDESNQTNAQLQQTGIYLNENGTAGTIQHIDLLV